MKTLIEKFTETVRLTATNFCLTDGLNRDGIDSISFTQHKRGLARYIYGKSCCLGGLTKSSNPKLYAIATDKKTGNSFRWIYAGPASKSARS